MAPLSMPDTTATLMKAPTLPFLSNDTCKGAATQALALHQPNVNAKSAMFVSLNQSLQNSH